MRILALVIATTACALLACSPTESAEANRPVDAAASTLAARDGSPPRPNIVFILADDLGWKDVSYHESEIKTPHIDRLAASGVRLERHYALPVCTPTRAALMTGRYPIRYGLQGEVIKLGDRFGLALDERTIAQALSEAGYATALSGKWHLGDFEDAYKPTRRGFDHQYGHYTGEIDYYTHKQGDGKVDWFRDDEPLQENGYSTTLIADEAVRRIADRDPKKPFFLYVAFNAPHRPLQAPKRYVEPYAHIANEPRRWKAAATAALDEGVGRIVAALDEHGLRDCTLVVFASDNGGLISTTNESNNAPLRGGKGAVYEGGVRVVACASWPGVLEAGRAIDEPVHVVDWYPTLARLAGARTEQEKPLDGLDIWPTLTSGALSPHADILINARPERSALVQNEWKVVKQRRGDAESIELFDLAHDVGETTDLSEREPARTRELLDRLTEYEKASAPPISLR